MIVYLILSIHLQIENRNPQDPTKLEIQFLHILLMLHCWKWGVISLV